MARLTPRSRAASSTRSSRGWCSVVQSISFSFWSRCDHKVPHSFCLDYAQAMTDGTQPKVRLLSRAPVSYGTRVVPAAFEASFDDPSLSFTALLEVVVSAGDARVVKVVLERRDARERITSVGLRGIPLAAWVDQALRAAPDMSAKVSTDAGTWSMPTMSGNRAELLQQVADAYRASVRQGSRRPTADAARALARPRETVARLLVDARKAGLLGPAPGRGRSGEGEPMDSATQP